MALSPAQMQEAIIRNLPEKTGKTLEEWVHIARSFGLVKNADIVRKLKSDYGLGHVQAQTVAGRMHGAKPYVETRGYEEGIFRSPATLAAYRRLRETVKKLGADVRVQPCKTYVPFYRKKQFAILTEKKGALLLGLNLPETGFDHLDDARNLGGSARINKMIVIDPAESGERLLPLLQTAYNRNA